MRLRVKNVGEQSAYCSVLDIQPNNDINLLAPPQNGRYQPDDFLLQRGETRTLPGTFLITKPYGVELFKLISSDKPLDLGAIVTTRGRSRGAGNNPFAELLLSSFKTADRSRTRTRAALVMSGDELVDIVDLSIRIVPRAQP